MNSKQYLYAAALLTAAAGTSLAEERVERSELPAPVQQSLQRATEQDQVKEITRRTQTVYEIQVEKQGRTERLVIAENGRILEQPGAGAARDTQTAGTSGSTSATSSTQASASEQRATSQQSATDRTRRTQDTAGAPTGRESGTSTSAPQSDTAALVVVEQVELRPVDTESMVPLARLPAAVRQGIEREAPGREIADIDREMWNGRAVYEVEFRDSGVNPRLHFTEDGMLVPGGTNTGDTIRNFFAGTQVNDTPSPVQEAIRREAAVGRVTDVDIERRTGRTVYEVEIRDAIGTYEIHFAEDGTILRHDRRGLGR